MQDTIRVIKVWSVFNMPIYMGMLEYTIWRYKKFKKEI